MGNCGSSETNSKGNRSSSKNVESKKNPKIDKDQMFVFKKAVNSVVNTKRIWTSFYNALDEAEEKDRFLKQEFNKNLRDSLNMGSFESTKTLLPDIRVKGSRHTEAYLAERRKSYTKKLQETSFHSSDVYNEEVYSHVPVDFLWNLTETQNALRNELPNHPVTGVQGQKEYEIAVLPVIDDDHSIDLDFIHSMISELRREKVISYHDAFHILRSVLPSQLMDENISYFNIPDGVNLHVVGDIHGQLDDLLTILNEAGEPSETNWFIFNGDFVDRGDFSCEVTLLLCAYHSLYPKYVKLNRGNHECMDMNSVDGFKTECLQKYNLTIYNYFNYIFAALPIGHLVQAGSERILIVHAGLAYEDATLDYINGENRYMLSLPMNSILQDMLWSDPYLGSGRTASNRGAGCHFGQDVVEEFMEKNKVNLIIRSHEMETTGFSLWFNNRLYSIFSASDYCGDSGNYGAFCTVSAKNPSPEIKVFMAKRQMVGYSERQVRLRQAVMTKLMVRICSKIYEIEEMLNSKKDENGTVSRIFWSYTLYKVLGIDGIYNAIGKKLGLSHPRRVNIAEWTSKFKPTDHLPNCSSEETLRRKISALLFDSTSPFRSSLETLFEHFDVDHDGSITLEEFKNGLKKLMSILKLKVTEEEVEGLLTIVDSNNDGEVDFNEFFNAFAYGHVQIDKIALN